MTIGASLVSAGSNLAGGAISHFLGRRAEKRAYKRQLAAFPTLVRQARAHGIHPLAAMGSAATYQPGIVTSGLGTSVSAAGDAISDGYQNEARRQQQREEGDRREARDLAKSVRDDAYRNRLLDLEEKRMELDAQAHMVRTAVGAAARGGVVGGPTPPSFTEPLPGTTPQVVGNNSYAGPNPDAPDLDQWIPWLLLQGIDGIRDVGEAALDPKLYNKTPKKRRRPRKGERQSHTPKKAGLRAGRNLGR